MPVAGRKCFSPDSAQPVPIQDSFEDFFARTATYGIFSLDQEAQYLQLPCFSWPPFS